MTYSDDHIALAAEYALGTLNADERALVETMMIVDQGFMDMVNAWERKLAPLHQMVGSVEPANNLWPRIKAAAGLTGQQPQITGSHENATVPVTRDEPVTSAAATSVAPEPVVTPQDHIVLQDEVPPADDMMPDRVLAPIESNVTPISASKRSGSRLGFVMSAMAAALAGVVALQAYRPDLLPEKLRVKPKIQIVEVKTPATSSAQLVAVLQQNASEPAFILTVDTATKNFTIRKVGAPPQPGKSFELWIVSDKLQQPRSLGVIGETDFTTRPVLASYDKDIVDNATYAVTVERHGGSPTGQPTSNPLWAGKLVESVPAQTTR